MLGILSSFVNEILTNTDGDQVRSVEPIDNDDKKSIIPLRTTESLILWNRYFSETIKYALQFERTYGEPVETPVFDESKIDSTVLKQTLKSMHTDETPILIYWNSRVALKTTWGMFVKYWDNFFYYPEDAIIYVNHDQVYFYNEMILKKIDKSKLQNISGESIFEYLKRLEVKKALKSNALDSLLKGFSTDLQDGLYSLFDKISEGLRVIEEDEVRREYMEYLIGVIWSNTEKIVLMCKPYNEKSLRDFIKILDENKKVFGKSSAEKFYELLKKLALKTKLDLQKVKN